jgi:phage-related protein
MRPNCQPKLSCDRRDRGLGRISGLKGFANLVEGSAVVEDFRGDTFRAVYTLKYSDSVCLLHAVQKKSKSGRETPRRDVELIERRLREGERIAKGRKS